MAEFPALPFPSEGIKSLSIEKFLELLDGVPQQGRADLAELQSPRLLTIDVRSPAEFQEGHVPGAINIPLFDNETRALVGTDFKRKGRYEAIRKGLQLAGPNFARFLDILEENGAKPGNHLLVYCWRGGMRSGSMAWLFSLCGYQVQILQGGYRSYRRWCKTLVGSDAAAPAPVMVLAGCTGVGKTAILHELRRRGEQVLDLEGLAKHRGSAFGGTGEVQPSNEAYENILAFAVRRVDPKKALWIEHEEKHVGKAVVPVGIVSWVSQATGGAMLVISMPKELRVQRLVEDYCRDAQAAQEQKREQLKECISGGLAKRLGGQRVKDALRLLDESRWDEVASMMLDYYDKLYEKWASQSRCLQRINVDCPTLEAAENADRVLKAVEGFVPRPQEHQTEKPTSSDQTDQTEVLEGITAQGSCHCGEVEIICRGAAQAVSYCHCSICRRLSGSAFSCQALFNSAQVELKLQPGANLTSLRTSKGVERSRCTSCMAPVRGLLGGKVAAIPLGLLCSWRETDGHSALRPMHHLYYANRVMDVRDGLPKYVGSLRTAKFSETEWWWNGQTEMKSCWMYIDSETHRSIDLMLLFAEKMFDSLDRDGRAKEDTGIDKKHSLEVPACARGIFPQISWRFPRNAYVLLVSSQVLSPISLRLCSSSSLGRSCRGSSFRTCLGLHWGALLRVESEFVLVCHQSCRELYGSVDDKSVTPSH